MVVRKNITKIAIAVIVLFSMTAISRAEEYEFPSWVPKEAIEAANNAIGGLVYFKTTFVPMYSDTVITEDDLEGCKLRYACERVCLDYEKYEDGTSISSLFIPPPRRERSIVFLVFKGDKLIGDILADFNVEYCEKRGWSAYGRGGIYDPGNRIFTMFESHPYDDGYRIYKEYQSSTYYLVKDEQLVSGLTFRGKYQGFVELSPVEFEAIVKKRIRQHRLMLDKQMTE